MKKGRALTGEWNWRTWVFWRNLGLVFLVTSWFGHFVEILVVLVGEKIFGQTVHYGILEHWWEPYAVWGQGAVVTVLILEPIKRKSKNFWVTLLAGVVLAGLVELTASLVICWWFGVNNPFWNYSEEFMNLGGHICLRNTLFFGALMTAFVWWVWPRLVKLLGRANGKVLNVVLAVLATAFGAYYIVSSLAF